MIKRDINWKLVEFMLKKIPELGFNTFQDGNWWDIEELENFDDYDHIEREAEIALNMIEKQTKKLIARAREKRKLREVVIECKEKGSTKDWEMVNTTYLKNLGKPTTTQLRDRLTVKEALLFKEVYETIYPKYKFRLVEEDGDYWR